MLRQKRRTKENKAILAVNRTFFFKACQAVLRPITYNEKYHEDKLTAQWI